MYFYNKTPLLIIPYSENKSRKKPSEFLSNSFQKSIIYIFAAITSPISEQETFFIPSDMISPVR